MEDAADIDRALLRDRQDRIRPRDRDQLRYGLGIGRWMPQQPFPVAQMIVAEEQVGNDVEQPQHVADMPGLAQRDAAIGAGEIHVIVAVGEVTR